jgi:hypothetical protein
LRSLQVRDQLIGRFLLATAPARQQAKLQLRPSFGRYY